MSHPEEPKAQTPDENAAEAPVTEEVPALDAAPAEGDSDAPVAREPSEDASEDHDTPGDDDAPEGVVSMELLQAQIGALVAQVAELQGRNDEATAKLRAVSKAYHDLQGDYEAFRQRMTQQNAVIAERKAAEAVERFFDPVQNLKRSLDAAGEHADTGFAQGLKIVQHQFDEAMVRLGLEKVASEGADFDPNVHEALAITPVADASLDGKVLHVHQDGYVVKGRVIQAAQVVIGKFEGAEEAEEPSPEPIDVAEEPAAEEPAAEDPSSNNGA